MKKKQSEKARKASQHNINVAEDKQMGRNIIIGSLLTAIFFLILLNF